MKDETIVKGILTGFGLYVIAGLVLISYITYHAWNLIDSLKGLI